MPATFAAAMRGAIRARDEENAVRRDLALMTAYYSGHLSQHNWNDNRIPSRFQEWRDLLVHGRPKQGNRALIAFFESRIDPNSRSH